MNVIQENSRVTLANVLCSVRLFPCISDKNPIFFLGFLVILSGIIHEPFKVIKLSCLLKRNSNLSNILLTKS